MLACGMFITFSGSYSKAVIRYLETTHELFQEKENTLNEDPLDKLHYEDFDNAS